MPSDLQNNRNLLTISQIYLPSMKSIRLKSSYLITTISKPMNKHQRTIGFDPCKIYINSFVLVISFTWHHSSYVSVKMILTAQIYLTSNISLSLTFYRKAAGFKKKTCISNIFRERIVVSKKNFRDCFLHEEAGDIRLFIKYQIYISTYTALEKF